MILSESLLVCQYQIGEYLDFLDASTHLFKRVCPSVVPSALGMSCFFFNETIMGENGRKLLGKQTKCSRLVKKSSDFPKMSTAKLRRIVVRMNLLHYNH